MVRDDWWGSRWKNWGSDNDDDDAKDNNCDEESDDSDGNIDEVDNY